MPSHFQFAATIALSVGLFAIGACNKQSPPQANSSGKAPAGSSQVASEASGDLSAGASRSASDHATGFDYYLLVLSWAPEYCATHSNHAGSAECDADRHFGYIVHGMWPENDNGSHPQDCGPGSPVAQSTVRRVMAIMPARGLIQHEWREHGACTGLSAPDYFADVEKSFGEVKVPPKYSAPAQEFRVSPSEMEDDFAKANNVPSEDFRISCSDSELVAVEACLTKDLQYERCPSSLRDCRASQVLVRPAP